MPLQHGRLNDHINRVFGGKNTSTFWQRLQEWEEEADLLLENVDTTDDPFRVYLRDLPRDVREEMVDLRGGIFGFEDLFGDPNASFSTYKPAVQAGVKDGKRVAAEKGFGSFYLPRESFIGATAEEAAAKLAFVTQTVDIHPHVSGAAQYSLSGSTMRARTFLDAGQQLANIDQVMSGTRLVFDVESAGLDPEKGIWQLSARLMQGDEAVIDAATGKERSVNLRFRNPNMDGLYGKNFQTFEDFYEAMVGGNVEWIDDKNFVRGMTEFLELSRDADYLVGQNTSFDVNMLYQALKGKENASPEFKKLVDGLRQQVEGGKVVDTRLFSKAVLGDIGIAKELTQKGDHTKHSVENILLKTSFLEDLAADIDMKGQKGDGWKYIDSLLDRGLHYGDVDIEFEDHLFRMLGEVLSGKRTNILTAKDLTDPDRVAKILKAQALTPVTISETGFTPMMNLVHHQRRWDSDLASHSSTSKLRQGGIFRNWADSILTKRGVLQRKVRLTNAGFDAVQAAAMEQNIPFAGLSAMERLLSTQLGRHSTSVLPGKIDSLRKVMGDVVGGTVFEQRDQMAIFGNKNVALPMELIQAAERSQLLDEQGVPVLKSRFASALETGVGDLQTVRLSTIHWGDQKDIAIVADLFETDDDVERFIKFLRGLDESQLEQYGIASDLVDEYASVLRNHGREYGIQIGILRGKNNRDIRGVVNALEDFGYGVDSANPPLRAAVYGIEGQEGIIGTTPVIADTQNVFTKMRDTILAHTRGTAELANEMADPNLDPSIARSIEMGAGGEVNKIYSFVDKQLQNMKKVRPKHLGLAAGGFLGYYLLNRRKEREPYTETFSQQEFEDDQFYEEYKAEMGEPVPANYRVRQSAAALDTAGMVQRLDRTKIGHHNMSSDKYSHLFGG